MSLKYDPASVPHVPSSLLARPNKLPVLRRGSSSSLLLARVVRYTKSMSLKYEPALEPQRFYQASGGRVLLDDLLVRIHFIIVMIRWTGLAPGSLTSTFLSCAEVLSGGRGPRAA